MESEGTEVIRILLVDDVEKIRESLRSILGTYPHFEIVGEACDGEDAVLAVARLKPSVVVMDINMPRLNGIEATAWIRRTYPHVVVVGVSAIATEDTCQLMKAAGATTVISKDAVEQLQRVIRESVGQEAKSTGKQFKGIGSGIGVMCNPHLR
jgi:DNA-binding NarL/FixJ family response regulator